MSKAHEFTTGDRIAVRRHSGAAVYGTVREVGPWHKSCAGSPMRWIEFVDASGAVRTVADTPHRDNVVRWMPPYVPGTPGEYED